MVDWNTALRIFIAGIIGVFVVMALLQVFTHLNAAAVRFIESRGKRGRDPAEKPGTQE